MISTAEFVAAVAGGHVSFDSTERSRKTGNQHVLDIAVWMPDKSGEEKLSILQCAPPEKPAGLGIVEAAAAAAEELMASAVTVCSPAGFTRPARKRSTELEVELFTPGEPGETEWPAGSAPERSAKKS